MNAAGLGALLALLTVTFSQTAPKSSPKTIPLSGGLLHPSGFYLNATIGSQPFTLQIDISYASLLIPKIGCVGCRLGDRRYDPAKTSTSPVPCADARCAAKSDQCKSGLCYKCNSAGHCCTAETEDCAVNVVYGDGSAGNGTLYRDTLSFSGISADVLFGAMHEESHNFELPYVDGVIGLAYKAGACRPVCVPPVMDAIVNATGLTDAFTICVTRFGGTLVLGGLDRTLATRAYDFVDVVADARESRYIMEVVPEWKVGTTVVNVPGATKAMWTMGTSDVGLTRAGFLAILGHLTKNYCHVEGLCSTTSWFRPQQCTVLADEIVAAMPNITIGVRRGLGILLTPEDYLLKYRVVHGQQARCVALAVVGGLEKIGVGVLLGTTVMRRYAVAFDRAGGKIGIAGAAPGKCGPETGSTAGLPGGSAGETVTAGAVEGEGETVEGDVLSERERCRAEKGCSGCARLQYCRYGYRTGRCVRYDEVDGTVYPSCAGRLCACFVTGTEGWYVGLGLGVLVGAGLGVLVFVFWQKSRRRNTYVSVASYEEHDLETF